MFIMITNVVGKLVQGTVIGVCFLIRYEFEMLSDEMAAHRMQARSEQ
jgi:hypothetical protein